MNRFLFGSCLIVLLGCGARTESFADLDGAGGQGASGPSATGGAPQAAGALNTAGAPGFGGGPIAGGAPGISGSFNVAGLPGAAGIFNVAGSPAAGGTFNVAGSTGVGGIINVAGTPGTAGSGATSGIVEACQAIAGDSCQQCLCKTCSSQLVQCFSNFGCALILVCAQQSGCQGLACYTAQTCRSTIDQFGGLTGGAMRDVLSLLTCSAGSQNSCNCN